MSIRLRVISLSLLLLIFTTPLAKISDAATPNQPISDVVLMSPNVQLFGHVKLVNGYVRGSFSGCYAVIALRDTPGKTIVIIPSDQRLRSLLETALATGYIVSFVGQCVNISTPPPRGGSWNMDVYNIDEITLYDSK